MNEIINKLVENKWIVNVFHSVIIILISFILYKSVTYILTKNGRFKLFTSNKSKTYMRMLKSIIRYLFLIITVLIILQINGVNVSSMLAGVGIIGVIIGFAVQDALKDIIKGFDILSDSYYRVGDVIKYKEIEGKVLAIGLKTTKVEDVNTLNIVSISNRNIEEVEVVSNLINIDIPFSYELKVDNVEKVIEEINKSIKSLKIVDSVEYRGINDLAESSIKYQIKVYCNPLVKVQTRRDALRCIVKVLEDNNIDIPYNQIDVHQK